MNTTHQSRSIGELISSATVPQKVMFGVAAFALVVGGTAVAIPGSQRPPTGDVPAAAAPAESTPTAPADVLSADPPTNAASAPTPSAVEPTDESDGGTPAAPGQHVPDDEADEGASGDGEIVPASNTGDAPATPQPGDDGGLDPVGAEPAEWCLETLAGGDRVAAPSDIVLEPGVMTGAFTLHNCSEDDVDVELAAQYFVELDDESFTMASGEERTVGFSIDRDAHETGAIETKIKVEEVDCCASYTDVHAFKTRIGLDAVASTDFTAAPGSGGCNNDCITTAVLTPNAMNTNIHLRVETDTVAALELTVDTSAPGEDADGQPVLPSPFFTDSSGLTTSWEASITDLAAASDYHLVLRATDEFGNATVVTTPFRSRTPVDLNDQLGGNDPEPGCSYQCITTALLSDTDHNSTELAVTTHTPATIDVFVGTESVVSQGDDLVLPEADQTKTSTSEVEQWSTTINDLQPATTYSILMRATDGNGNQSFQTGSFTTGAEPTTPVTVTFERFYVHENGDRVRKGEIAFGWGFVLPDGTTTSSTRGESKIDDHQAVWLTSGTTWTYHIDSTGHLPTLRAIAGERDGNAHFACPPPTDLYGGCSYAKYTAAEYEGPSLDDISSMGGCGELLAEVDPLDRCIILEGPDHGTDRVRFDTVVRFVVG